MNNSAATQEATPHSLSFSVLILTLNEEVNLPDCLASIIGCDDIVVLDSGSTDRTVEIAREGGARVFAREFDTFAQQRNYAQREIPFRHPWVLHLDADERVPAEFRNECGGVIESQDVDGFFADTKIMWNGKWVRHSSTFPQPHVRFVRAPEFQFVEGPDRAAEAAHMRMDALITCPVHEASSRGAAERMNRHRHHAVSAARYRLATRAQPLRDVFSRDAARRQLALRRASYALPFRPTLRFFYRYLLCRGFLDGVAGLDYCRQLARNESLTAQDLRRLRDSAGAVART